MSPSSNQEIESRGATVETAIVAGLQRLRLGRDQVTVTVIDEGSRGLLGIGSREAVVRLIARPVATEPSLPPSPPVPKAQIPQTPKPQPPQATQTSSLAPKPTPPPKPAESRPAPTALSLEDGDGAAAESTSDELDAERDTAVDVISELLEKMRISARVSSLLSEPDNLTGRQVNIIDIGGDDLAVLIGPRGETLDSLQFLSRLMVSHKLHRRVDFVVDVEGYRKRREQALTRLAERMADKVRQRGEAITLEPMSAYERRIIHMTLRDAPDVYTESAGEGKQRRVRIFPKD